MITKNIRILQEEISFWFEGVLALLPYGRIGNQLRRLYWSKKLKVPDGDITIYPGVRFFCTDALRIGKGLSINFNVLIDPCEGGFISIGDNVLIGPNCILRAADHVFSDVTKPIKFQGHRAGYIIIEDNCWLGAYVVILKNVTVGEGSVIAAGAVVTKDIPPFSLAAGVPAQVIKQLKLQESDP